MADDLLFAGWSLNGDVAAGMSIQHAALCAILYEKP